MFILKLAGKILLLPVWLILFVIGLAVKMTVQTYTVVRGILGFIFTLLIIATAYCYHDWVQVAFLFSLSVILYLILFAGEEVYISMINKAEKYCWFMTPYLIITDEMTHALCLAAKRGVDVRIITPGIPDKKFIYNITRSFYHGLVKHGVRVYEWTPGFCHAKMSVADDCMATCGTINLDYRSLYHHFENGCFMADCQAVVEIKNDLIRTMGECRDVTDQYQTGRSAYLRLGQLFMRLFAGLL